MKPAVLIVALVLALVAFGCTFGGTTFVLTVTQPAAPGSTAKVSFEVKPNDSANAVADRLQEQGLIRNATLFKLLAETRGLASQLRAGTYSLSPGMSMDAIMQELIAGSPEPQVSVTFPEGWRVTEYPYPVHLKDPKDPKSVERFDLSTKLPNFNKGNFLKIVKTGKWLDGSDVYKDYWFMPPPPPNVAYALEGYLFPSTYFFNASADETIVVRRLLDQFGLEICPDPGGPPDASSYFHNKATCLKHQATVDKDNKVGIFDAVKKNYFVTDEAQALYRALTLSSIVQKEAGGFADFQGVSDVLYNRFAVSQRKMQWPPSEPIDTFNSLGADATAQYARDTDTPPSDPLKYWAPIKGSAQNTDPNNLYNTNNGYHKGLPPGPISAPSFDYLAAAANPNPDGGTAYFFYMHDGCSPPKVHYAVTFAAFQNVLYRYDGKCPA